MTKPNDGGPAFPVPTISGPDLEVSYPPHVRGMTLRDWFAGQASETDILFHSNLLFAKRPDPYPTREECKYAYADAMLAAREA